MPLTWTDDITGFDWPALEALYHAAPLGNKSAEHLRSVFTASRLRCFAWDGGHLIGAGRALADGADTSYVCDIAVMPSHQGMGVGKAIVNRLVAASAGHKKILLYAVPGKEAYYWKLGFRRMLTAMAIFDDQARALARGHISDT